jgi:hypothetical protein
VRRLSGAEVFARAPLVDALLYCTSALFAVRVLGTSSMVRNRTWAELAWPAYAAGAVAAICLVRLDGARLTRARALLAVAVGVAVVLVPLGVEVHRRSEVAPLHPYGSSEVVVVERAAQRVLGGRDPYSVRLDSPELAGRSPSTPEHFPYLPGMIAFGLPRALVHSPWTDARIAFLLATLGVGAFAFARWRAPPERRLRALQVLVVLPTGAAALATGGDDIPVLALGLLALVLFDSRRHTASAATAAAAAAMKLTAWPLLLALAIGMPRRRAPLALGGAGLVLLAAAAAGPADFVDDVVLFPAGLTNLPTPAATTTLGSVMIGPLRSSSPNAARVILTIALAAIVLLVTVTVLGALARRARVSASDAALAAGVVLLAAIALAPVARAGYLVYPVDLLVWAALMRGPAPVVLPVAEGNEAVAW